MQSTRSRRERWTGDRLCSGRLSRCGRGNQDDHVQKLKSQFPEHVTALQSLRSGGIGDDKLFRISCAWRSPFGVQLGFEEWRAGVRRILDSWRQSQNDVVVREIGTFCRPIYVVAPMKCVHDGNTFPYMLVRDLNCGISFLCMGVYVSLGILLQWGSCDIPAIYEAQPSGS